MTILDTIVFWYLQEELFYLGVLSFPRNVLLMNLLLQDEAFPDGLSECLFSRLM